MSGLLSKVGGLALLLLFAAAAFVFAFFYFHRGSYQPPPTVTLPVDQLGAPQSSLRALEELPLIQKGTLVVDGIHGNQFLETELSPLLDRVADRGYEVDVVGVARRGGGFGSYDQGDRLELMEEKLRNADSLLVVAPATPYTQAEADMVERYILSKGGKLLLVGDPTRSHNINSLAERFGIKYRRDYLYNLTDYDLNFQNVFMRDFREDDVTEGLKQVVFYTASSVTAPTPGLAFTAQDTRSSLVEQPNPFSTMVKAGDGRVIALTDLTFMVPPRNSILDNDRLISNLSDYLTSGQRRFDLDDFPSFFKDDVDVVLGRSSLFDVVADVKGVLSEFRIDSNVQAVEDITKDTLYLGLYEDAADVAQYLEVAGLALNDVLRTPFTADIEKEATAVILLHPGPDRHALVVLGDSEESLRKAISYLSSGRFRSGLVDDFVGVYRTE